MNAKNWMIFLLVLGCLQSGCRKPNPWYVQDERPDQYVIDQDIFSEGTETPDVVESEDVDARDWNVFKVEDTIFLYPANWFVEMLSNDETNDVRFSFRVKDTNREILFGAVAPPEDFFVVQDGEKIVNIDKYAMSYSFIQVDVYADQSEKSWETFFREKFSDVVLMFEPVQSIFLREGSDAMRASKINGIFSGEVRIFVKKGDFVFDMFLIVREENVDRSLRIFNSFLKRFQF